MRYAFETAAITKEYHPGLVKRQLEIIDIYVEEAAKKGQSRCVFGLQLPLEMEVCRTLEEYGYKVKQRPDCIYEVSWSNIII